ncbi:MAG: nucleotidyl transferase AbiEii/AbiGii toxin family protein [Vampirovibrionales bacterium]|nr:nucleotidyl transferase AbiEii/AbiGii toxin family protein [Vampirovibrionales bacterium]
MPPPDFLHRHPNFPELLQIVGREMKIEPALVEKDYWIMHCLYGLQQMALTFELKGGTSLSKGFGIIHRFSEDIDIRIEPPAEMDVKTGRNHDKDVHRQGRKHFYDWLSETIQIDGIVEVKRDSAFDDEKYRSGGIRLHYHNTTTTLPGLKDGILLEVGFDDVEPNISLDISSWAYDYAASKVEIIDNRAKGVKCYHPGKTLVEKLQTVSTKFRQQQTDGTFPVNFMRHYYDVYCLLQNPDVQAFIGTPEYQQHKERRFRGGDNPVIAENEAFLLSDANTRQQYAEAYQGTRTLYYKSQPSFDDIMAMVHQNIDQL